MIYITQLIFIKPGKEEIFLEFEKFAIPLLEKYNGKVLYRIRPDKANFIDNDKTKVPYEIHFISFESEGDLTGFLKDDERSKFIHLKEESVESVLLVKGRKMN